MFPTDWIGWSQTRNWTNIRDIMHAIGSGLVTDIVWWSWNWILSLFVQGLTDTLTHHSIQFKESARIIDRESKIYLLFCKVFWATPFSWCWHLLVTMMITVMPSPDHSTSRCGWSRREPVRVWELDPTNLAMSKGFLQNQYPFFFKIYQVIYLYNHKELLF